MARFKTTALMTVGVAPLQSAVNPYSLTILENAFPTPL